MEIFKGQNLINFGKVFPDDDSCLGYLFDLKWKDGFVCTKCGNTSGCEKSGHKYHCYSCNHVESATAGTLFHRVRFGLHKAFHIVFEMVNSSKGISSIQVGLRYGIRQPTAWTFMHKVRKAMESSKKYPMSDLVHVDEFVVGGMEEGKKGRSYNTQKTKAVVAVELSEKHQVKRVYIKAIDDYSAKSLTPIFEQHISESAKVVTDKWKGYLPLSKKYNIEQISSDQGKYFKQLHLIIHQIKSWIRTIPTHVSKKHVESYFNEFSYRINRSQNRNTIFHNIIQRMLNAKPLNYDKLIRKLSV
ncbi:transposase [Chryseobacterium piperi]|uniref:Transposase n=1 Tax=Chryseobacterium piperi TaxID=558152 RepID=A0A086BKF2_9FLAO|nr:IS1595 family transposase [Chryseobacterium piperi]KFF29416.1 transposase [Chryseobacterium piperi]